MDSVTAWRAIAGVLVASGVLLAAAIIRHLARRAWPTLSGTSPWLTDLARALATGTSGWLVSIVSVGAGLAATRLETLPLEAAGKVAAVAVALQGGLWASTFASLRVQALTAACRDEDSRNAVAFVNQGAQLSVALLTLVLALSNAGVDVTALVASLGVGGFALALASHGALKDYIACFTIMTERFFRVGDHITGNGFAGRVERIAARTTVVRSDDGTRMLVPNSQVVSAGITNESGPGPRLVGFEAMLDPAAGSDAVAKAGLAVSEALRQIPGLLVLHVAPGAVEPDGVRLDIRVEVDGTGGFVNQRAAAVLAVLQACDGLLVRRACNFADPVRPALEQAKP